MDKIYEYYYGKKEEITNFPNKGDNKKISLSNSNFGLPSFSYVNGIKERSPKFWARHGNGGSGKDKTSFTGKNAFSKWKSVRSGNSEESWIKRRERFLSRMANNVSNPGGILAVLMWAGKPTNMSWGSAKAKIEEQIKKENKD